MKESSELSHRLDNQGFREGDKFIIRPMQGRNKEICLKRTEFSFVSRHFIKGKMNGCYCHLPEMKNESFEIKIFKQINRTQLNTKRERFVVKSLEGGPFKLNGTFHFESFLERGDKLEIGYNTIFFKNSDETENRDSGNDYLVKNTKLVHSQLPILLYGETGVGKSSLAKAIHEQSDRAGSFVQVNIAALSKNLVESELFGHIKGAFTGAISDKNGFFKQANYGTLFIDEIDSLPLDIQTKLLLFLDGHQIQPVGSTSKQKLDVRLIFASGRDLVEVVDEGLMRKDFFFRITSGATHKLKALRDAPDLIEAACEEFALAHEVKISQKLIEFYQSLPWPGNYRQLKGHLESKRVLSMSSRLDFDHFDEKLIEQSSELSAFACKTVRPTLKQVKLAYAQKVFLESDKNYTKASEVLGISAKCLKSMVKL